MRVYVALSGPCNVHAWCCCAALTPTWVCVLRAACCRRKDVESHPLVHLVEKAFPEGGRVWKAAEKIVTTFDPDAQVGVCAVVDCRVVARCRLCGAFPRSRMPCCLTHSPQVGTFGGILWGKSFHVATLSQPCFRTSPRDVGNGHKRREAPTQCLA